MKIKEYFNELKRRNVFKAALAYVVVSWIIIQVASIVLPAFNAPGAVIRTILIILLIGFPVWLVFAWIYEMTPEGLKQTQKLDLKASVTAQTSNKLNILIFGALVIVIILLSFDVYNTFHPEDNKRNRTSGKALHELYSEETDTTDERSIAVLAFDDMSPLKDQEYFADGISEEILNYLAKIPHLKVISRTSSFAYKGSSKDVKAIAEELGVAYVLEGSVRKSGDKVRVTTQLVHADDREDIWSETYDRKLKDIFKIQEDIAEEVSANLETSVLNKNIKETSTEAYTDYLQAKHLFYLNTPGSGPKALALLKKAVAIDSTYSPAWTLISKIYKVLGYTSGSVSRDEAHTLGVQAAEKAIALDSTNAEAYIWLAFFNQVAYDFKKAKQNAEKAMNLDPNNPAVLRNAGHITFSSVPQMIVNTKKCLQLDPLYYWNYYMLGLFYYWQEKNGESLKYISQFQEYQPGSMVVNSLKTRILLAQGQTAEALKTIEKEPHMFWRSYGKIIALYQAGQKKAALRELRDFIKKNPNSAANIADIYAFMGDRENTFKWLEKAVSRKDPIMVEAIYYPSFKKFYDDPRWMQVLKRMGVPEENEIPGYKRR